MPARNTRHGVTDVKVPGMNAKKNDFSYSFLLKNFMRGGRVNDNA